MSEYHFIAGLPRSGSTLLASLFNQHPNMVAGITGPAAGVFNAVQTVIAKGEASGFLSQRSRKRLLRNAITACHDMDGKPTEKQIIWDTNRSWPAKLSILADLFPNCRMICCVREIPWIVDSIEKLIRKNVYDVSGIFGFEPGMTVFDRSRSLTNGGLIGSANMAMMDAFYGDQAERMLFVEYDALTKYPGETMNAIHDWMGLTQFSYDFEAIKPIEGASEFDKKMGTPGLHALGERVRNISRETILPPEIFNSFGDPFWRRGSPKAKIIRCGG